MASLRIRREVFDEKFIQFRKSASSVYFDGSTVLQCGGP